MEAEVSAEHAESVERARPGLSQSILRSKQVAFWQAVSVSLHKDPQDFRFIQVYD